jgi:hypothetical protein
MRSPAKTRPCQKLQLDARLDACITKAAPFAQSILAHIREPVLKTLPNTGGSDHVNEYLPDNEIVSIASLMSQTTLDRQHPQGEMQ